MSYSISEVINPLTDSLSTTFVEFIDGMRLVIEMEADKEYPLGNDVRLQFSRFIHNLIHNTPGSYALIFFILLPHISMPRNL